MFKKLLLICTLLMAAASAATQVPTDAIYPRFRPVQPVTACTPNFRTTPLIVYRSNSPAGVYYCRTDGTWRRIGDLEDLSGTNFFPYFDGSSAFVASPLTWDGTTYEFGGGTNLELAFTPGSGSGGSFLVGHFTGGPGINVGLTINGTTGDAILQAGGALILQGAASIDGTLSIGGGTALTTSNATGTGNLVKATSPTLVTPTLGAASATSIAIGGGSALTTSTQTGTGNLVLAISPTLTTPSLGAATATSINLGSAAVTDILTGTASLNYVQAAGNVCETLTIAVTGAADGNVVQIGIPNALADENTTSTFFPWVSATNTVSVRRCVIDADGSDPAAATVRAVVTQF